MATSAQAREWSQEEIVLESIGVGLIWVDITQTKKFLRHGVSEANIILGKHPTDAELNKWGVITSLSHVWAVNKYPEYSLYLQWGLIILEGAVIKYTNDVVPPNARVNWSLMYSGRF